VRKNLAERMAGNRQSRKAMDLRQWLSSQRGLRVNGSFFCIVFFVCVQAISRTPKKVRKVPENPNKTLKKHNTDNNNRFNQKSKLFLFRSREKQTALLIYNF